MPTASSAPVPSRRKQTRAAAWSNPDAFATTLVILTVDEYGTEAFDWLLESLVKTIEEDHEVHFIELCNVLDGGGLSLLSWDPADARECAWGITEALLIESMVYGPPENEQPFADNIVGYVQGVVRSEGLTRPPDVLRLGGPAVPETLPAYRDDPAMYQAYLQSQQAESDDIRNYLLTRLRLLFEQSAQLPLEHGSTETLLRRLQQALRG
jgi:hypothetical protein